MPGGSELPPSLLADAWSKAEKVKELAERLKGCSIHVIGHRTGASVAAALALTRRLKDSRYRYLDLDQIVAQLLVGKGTPEPAELRALESAVLEEAKAWTRCVLLATGEPGSVPDNWAALHQGVCVLLTEAPVAGRPAPEPPSELWVEQADVVVELQPMASPDESALELGASVLSALIARPPKSEAWRQKRSDTLKERGLDPDGYDSA